MRALLDVNVLIALLDARHAHHESALRWLQENAEDGWASCPLTQLGCVRVMSQPRYPNTLTPRVVAGRLAAATRSGPHQFWADEPNLLDADVIDWTRVIGPSQLTDVYLLALAVNMGGRLVTRDARIPIDAVFGADPDHYCVI